MKKLTYFFALFVLVLSHAGCGGKIGVDPAIDVAESFSTTVNGTSITYKECVVLLLDKTTANPKLVLTAGARDNNDKVTDTIVMEIQNYQNTGTYTTSNISYVYQNVIYKPTTPASVKITESVTPSKGSQGKVVGEVVAMTLRNASTGKTLSVGTTKFTAVWPI